MRLNEQSIRLCVEDIKASNVHCLMLIMFLCGNINVKRWGLSFYSKPPKECQLQDNFYIVNFFLIFMVSQTITNKTHVRFIEMLTPP